MKSSGDYIIKMANAYHYRVRHSKITLFTGVVPPKIITLDLAAFQRGSATLTSQEMAHPLTWDST